MHEIRSLGPREYFRRAFTGSVWSALTRTGAVLLTPRAA